MHMSVFSFKPVTGAISAVIAWENMLTGVQEESSRHRWHVCADSYQERPESQRDRHGQGQSGQIPRGDGWT